MIAWARRVGAVALALGTMAAGSGTALAEGSAQTGALQRLREYSTQRGNPIHIDILAPGEWITTAACGDGSARNVVYELRDPTGAVVDLTPGVAGDTIARTGAQVGLPCDAATAMPPATIPNPVRHRATQRGRYELRLTNSSTSTNNDGTSLRLFDVTVMPDGTTRPSPYGANGYRGRVSATTWAFISYNFTEDFVTNADYYVLTPGGVPNTNYVWKLDFNNMAGYGYDVIANGIGVDSASSYSVPVAGNSVSPRYPLYLHGPAIAKGPPTAPPNVSSFRFRDLAGTDAAINPAATGANQRAGRFTFTTDTNDATYAIAIDTGRPGGGGPNGVYGDVGDVFLNGYTSSGTPNGAGGVEVAAVWDGRNVNGQVMPAGNYTAEVMVRLGEFHFVGRDIETSGGSTFAANPDSYGLTIFEMKPGGAGGRVQDGTQVYWDDESVLRATTTNRTGAPRGGPGSGTLPFTTPGGRRSGTVDGYHTWGDFPQRDDNTFAEDTYIDTFVYGRNSVATTPAQITADPNGGASGFATGYVQIAATNAGGTVDLLIGDADLDGDPSVPGTLDNGRGSSVPVTLRPDPNQAGAFIATVPTKVEGTAGAELPVRPGDTLTLTYTDANTGDGRTNVAIADSDVVGGTNGVPGVRAGIVGEPLTLTLADADIVGTTTVEVDVVNATTGEVERTVTLTRAGPNAGTFTATLPTTGGASGNDDGAMNVSAGDVVRIDYRDALRADGTTDQTVSDTDTVKSGTPAQVTIEATRVGEPVTFTVTDGDRAGAGTIDTEIVNLATGEAEIVALSERTGRPGVFEGAVATTYREAADVAGNPAPGTFDARETDPGTAGDLFAIRYEDVARPNGAPQFVEATDDIEGGADGAAFIVADAYAVGETLALRVVDTDLAGEPFVDVTVERRPQGAGPGTAPTETQDVRLTRDPSAPAGTFVGALRTAYGTGPDATSARNAADPSTDAINAVATDVMTLRYADRQDAVGGPVARTDTAVMTGGTLARVAIDATAVGRPLSLAVEDDDLTRATAVTVTVERRRTETGPVIETETLTLPRTSADGQPGRFTPSRGRRQPARHHLR